MEQITVQIALRKNIPKSQEKELNSIEYIKKMTTDMIESIYELDEEDTLIIQVEGN